MKAGTRKPKVLTARRRTSTAANPATIESASRLRRPKLPAREKTENARAYEAGSRRSSSRPQVKKEKAAAARKVAPAKSSQAAGRVRKRSAAIAPAKKS